MKKFKNTKKESFLGSIVTISLDDSSNDLTVRCKFNFGYFDIQEGISQNFEEWNGQELAKLLDKLKEYSKFSLEHWIRQKVGRYSVLVIYEQFPTKTDFVKPKHIPHQAKWARFHLENRVRVIGFVIPEEYHDTAHPNTGIRYDRNTFYVAYLDKEHKFYKTE